MDIMVTSQGGQANLNITKVPEVNQVSENKDVTKDNNINNGYKKEDLDKAINKLNDMLKVENTFVEYSVHEKLGDIMIKVVNGDTKEVIMEYPPEKILDLVAKMCEMAGIIVDKKA
ncbi:MAG: flagellar protein FlaG [Clostridiales bacterium]|nr:flagellar protein FlaG [Clostridiales bacterium]